VATKKAAYLAASSCRRKNLIAANIRQFFGTAQEKSGLFFEMVFNMVIVSKIIFLVKTDEIG